MTAERSASTDAALSTWRTRSLERRAAWEEARRIQREQMRKRFGRRALPLMLAAGVVWSVGAATVLIALATTHVRTPTAPAAVTATPVAAPVQEVVAPTPAPVAQDPIPQDPIRTVQRAAAWAPPIVPGTLRIWSSRSAEWVQLDTVGRTRFELQWLDADGASVLGTWPCAFAPTADTRRCFVGRTHQRIEVARSRGAAPGTWSVQLCEQAGSCAVVGQFDVL